MTGTRTVQLSDALQRDGHIRISEDDADRRVTVTRTHDGAAPQDTPRDRLPEIIDLMDSYFLTRDDFDAICELKVGEDDAKIDPPTKAAFTRT